MTNLPVYTALTAAMLMLLQMVLMLLVGVNRQKHAQLIGDGGNEAMLLAIRRHGNLAENAPLFLLVLGLVEVMVGQSTVVLWLACGFVTVRFAHAVGLSLGSGPNAPRIIGAFGTLTLGVGAASYLAYLVLGNSII